LDISEAVRIFRYVREPVGAHRDVFLLIDELLAKSNSTPWLKEDLEIDENSDIAYFAGCAPIYDVLLERDSNYSGATYAGIKVLNWLGIKPAVIYGCCGHDLYYSGRLDEFEELKKNLEPKLEGKHLVVGCAEGYHMLKNVYGAWVEFFSDFVRGKLDLNLNKLEIKTTYHDPCRLGRYNGLYESPRKLIEGSSDFREMEHHGEDARCCGVSAWLNCNRDSKSLREERIKEAIDSGADHLITSCLKCRIHFDCLFHEENYEGPKIELMDLQELVAESLGVYDPGSEKSYVIREAQGVVIPAENKKEKDIKKWLSQELVDNAFKCSSCHICTEVCPYDFETTEMMEELRSYLVEVGVNPEVHKKIYERIKKYGNPYGERGFISKEEEARVIYFPGCTAMYRQKNTMESTMAILEALGVKYSIPDGMVCCGSVLIRSGYGKTELVKELMERNKKIFGDKTVLVSCAGCYSTFKNDYEGVNVKHVAEFIGDRLKELDLKPIEKKVIYHDPCHLGRGGGVYEEPREAIKAIPGTELLEFKDNREKAICCGAGGGVKSSRAPLANDLAAKRAKEAKDAGAEVILSSCPFCELNIGENSEIETMNIMDYLLKSLKGGEK
jgi:Fe-S oxidoreductase